MIYVRIELWPNGDRAKARLLNEATIVNVSSVPDIGKYRAVLSDEGGFRPESVLKDYPKPAIARTWVYGWPRLERKAHELVAAAFAGFAKRS